jgi:hypothetical protein
MVYHIPLKNFQDGKVIFDIIKIDVFQNKYIIKSVLKKLDGDLH